MQSIYKKKTRVYDVFMQTFRYRNAVTQRSFGDQMFLRRRYGVDKFYHRDVLVQRSFDTTKFWGQVI